MFAELRIGLSHHLESASEPIEVVHIKRTEIDLHRLEQVLQRHALSFGFYTINFRVELRYVDGERREQSAEPWRLIAFVDQRLRILRQRVVAHVAAIFHIQLESANCSQSIYW